jgi:hypothetical protein
MSQPSLTVSPAVTDNLTPLFVESFEAITASDVVLDEDAWRALLIQIDREEDSG